MNPPEAIIQPWASDIPSQPENPSTGRTEAVNEPCNHNLDRFILYPLNGSIIEFENMRKIYEGRYTAPILLCQRCKYWLIPKMREEDEKRRAWLYSSGPMKK